MYKVLIVEDNAIQIEILTTFIDWESLGITEIKVAKNGEIGMKIYNEFHPDIIISDICMPKTNGIEMIKKIREDNKNVQVIFISAYDNFNYAKNAVDLSACGYLLKPFTPSQLQDVVEVALKKLENENRIEQFEKEYSESLMAYREMLLHMLKSNALSNAYRIQNMNKSLFLDDYRTFIICKIKYKNSDMSFSDNDFNILNIFKERLFEVYNGVGILEDFCSLVFLFYSKNDSEEAFSGLIDVLYDIKNELSNLTTDMCIGVSEPFFQIKNIQIMYHHAELSLNNQYLPAKENIFVYGDIEENTDYFSSSILKERLEKLKESYDVKMIDDIVYDFFPEDTKNIVSLKSTCFAFLTVIQIILIEYNLNINSILGADVWYTIENIQTIQNPKQWLKNMIAVAFESINEIAKSKYQKIIDDIKKYINENYADIHSVEQISSEFNISTSYAKQIFKQHTGKTIFEYLTLTRIEVAKKLLENPYIKVYEVSDKIGYSKTAYFSELFKRHTGMTPQQYQKKTIS